MKPINNGLAKAKPRGHRILFGLFGAALTLSLSLGCGKSTGDLSTQLGVAVSPETPLVVDVDATSGGILRPKAWFLTRIKVTNNAEKLPACIVAMTLTIKAFTQQGEQTNEIGFTTGTDGNVNLLAYLRPKETGYINRSASNVASQIVDAGGNVTSVILTRGYIPADRTDFVSSGLPGRPQLTQYTYRVTGRLIGWFDRIRADGTSDALISPNPFQQGDQGIYACGEAEARLDRTFTFSTQ
jgi:hypothetical protein